MSKKPISCYLYWVSGFFGYCYDMSNSNFADTTILKCCQDLQIHLTDNETKDLNGCDLYEELLIFRHLVDENIPLLQVLFEVKTTNTFPNISIALRNMLTIPLTSTGAERSFSKLKLIKTYLQSTMSQQRLIRQATICIEKELGI